MTPEDLGGHPILKFNYWKDAPPHAPANFGAILWSEKTGDRCLINGWITPELADDPVALRAYLLLSLEDAEQEAQP